MASDDEKNISFNFEIGERVLSSWKDGLLYEAKVIKRLHRSKGAQYLLHFTGWKKTYDEWIFEDKLLKYTPANLRKKEEILRKQAGSLPRVALTGAKKSFNKKTHKKKSRPSVKYVYHEEAKRKLEELPDVEIIGVETDQSHLKVKAIWSGTSNQGDYPRLTIRPVNNVSVNNDILEPRLSMRPVLDRLPSNTGSRNSALTIEPVKNGLSSHAGSPEAPLTIQPILDRLCKKTNGLKPLLTIKQISVTSGETDPLDPHSAIRSVQDISCDKNVLNPEVTVRSLRGRLPSKHLEDKSISEPQGDAFDLIGKNVTVKLKQIPVDQAIFAERLINEVLYEAQLGSLNRQSVLLARGYEQILHTDSMLQNSPAHLYNQH